MSSTRTERAVIAAIVAGLAIAAAAPASATARSPAASSKGPVMGVSLFAEGPLARPSERALRLATRLRALHVREISVVVPFGQLTTTANRVATLPGVTPSAARLTALVRALRKARLAVRIVPLLDERPIRAYRGSIAPSDRAAWFSSYATLIRRYAVLARRGGATGLTIGTELDSLMPDDSAWLRVLAAARSAFKGDISYAMNFTVVSHRSWPAWVGALDRIGVDAWFGVGLPDHASAAAITSALEAGYGAQLRDLRAAFPHVPIVFSEAGLRGQRGSFKEPYHWDLGGPDDDGIQRRWYRGICRWAQAARVASISWWRVDLDLPTTGRIMNGFNPLGRDAEREVRRCALGL